MRRSNRSCKSACSKYDNGPPIELLEDRRLFSQGGLDSSFGAVGLQTDIPSAYNPPGGLPAVIAEDAQGRILVASSFSTVHGDSTVVTRLESNGTVDPTFKTFVYESGGIGSYISQDVNQILPMSTGNILLLGSQIQELSSTGILSTSFVDNGVSAVAGVLLAGNKFMVVDGASSSVYQFNANGSPDSTFGSNGVLTLSSPYRSMTLQDILLDDSSRPVLSFSAQQSSGAMVAGTVRLTTSGKIDTTYGIGGFAAAPLQSQSSITSTLALAPAGTVEQLVNSSNIFDYSTDGKEIGGGAVVTSDDGSMTSSLDALTIESDGKVIAVGDNNSGQAVVDRFDAISPTSQQNLVYDPTFDGSGSLVLPTALQGFDSNANSVLLDTSGRIVTAAQGGVSASSGFLAVARVLTTGPTTSGILPATGKAIGTSGSWSNQGNTIAKVFDGNLSTYFDAPNASGGWVGLDLGTVRTIAQITYAPRPNWNQRMVGGMFQGSNTADFSSRVESLYTITVTPPVGQVTTVGIGNAGPFRYVRYIGPAGGYCNIAEAGFFATPEPITGTIIGTAGSFENMQNTIYNAFDGNVNTFFDAPNASGGWVGEDLGSAQIVTQVQYAPRAGRESRMVGGEFQASNSASFSSGVMTLYAITSTPAAGVLTTATLNNTSAYRYYRYLGPNGSYCNIAELEFDG